MRSTHPKAGLPKTERSTATISLRNIVGPRLWCITVPNPPLSSERMPIPSTLPSFARMVTTSESACRAHPCPHGEQDDAVNTRSGAHGYWATAHAETSQFTHLLLLGKSASRSPSDEK